MLKTLTLHSGTVLFSPYSAVAHTHRFGLHDLYACPYPRMNPSTAIGLGRSFRQYRTDLTWNRSASCCVPDTDCVDSPDGTAMLGMQAGANVASIDGFSWLDAADIPDNLAGVSNIEVLMGLMSFKVTVIDPAQPIQITFHFSEALPEGVECWKWDPDTGWYKYAHIVDISADRMSLTMEYQDGVLGDLDKLVNGVLIDPAGFGAAPAGGGAGGGGGGGGGGGCFISSASDTPSVMGKAAALMILLMGAGMIGLVGFKRN